MICKATVNDSARIAEIEVFSSRYAYQNIVSDECLFRDMSVEARIPVIRGWITDQRFELYVYEDPATGVVKGMMGIGMCEDEDKTNAFELHFIYVDPGFVRQGVGFELLQLFEQKGKEKGCSEYVIWVLEDNQMGKNFYEKNLYHFDGKDKIFRRWNKREIRYVKG